MLEKVKKEIEEKIKSLRRTCEDKYLICKIETEQINKQVDYLENLIYGIEKLKKEQANE